MVNQLPKLIIATALLILCGSWLHASTTPLNTQPVIPGQVALQNRDLSQGNTLGYRPWFEPGSWQGDIIEYEFSAQGAATTDVVIGVIPAAAGNKGSCNRPTSGCWSARASFNR